MVSGNSTEARDGEMVPECAVCGSRLWHPQWRIRDSLLDYPGSFDIIACDGCGTLRMSPRPSFSARRRSFTDQYPLYDWALGRKSAREAERIGRFSPQIAAINSRKQPGRLLDVGAGDGYFMLGMQQRGWETRGIELHEGVAAYARDELGLDMVAGAEHEVDWGGPYDCITLFGLIEDVDDPNACLSRCFDSLAPDGLLVVQTHNIGSLEARYFGPDWFNIEAPRHVWHFSPDTLRRLLDSNRFTQDRLLHYGSTYVTEQSIGQHRGRPFPSTPVDRVIRKLLISPAARLLPRIGQGIMIESYCHKQN